MDFVKEHNPNVDLSNMAIIDGYISYTSLQTSLKNALQHIKKCGFAINDYNISFHYKNIYNSVLYFREIFNCEEYKEKSIKKIKEYHFYTCSKNEVKTAPTHFINDVKLEIIDNISIQLMDNNFALIFGIDPAELLDKIIESIPLYDEKIFSSN